MTEQSPFEPTARRQPAPSAGGSSSEMELIRKLAQWWGPTLNRRLDEQLAAAVAPLQLAIADLQAENASLRAEVAELKARPSLDYAGVWAPGKSWRAGSVTTWQGALWIAMRDTDAKPGTEGSQWRLAVKSGRDGASAYDLARKHQNFKGTELDWLRSLRAKDSAPAPPPRAGIAEPRASA